MSSSSSLSSTTCYWPNGKPVTGMIYEPCDAGPDPSHAACCELSSSVCTEGGYCVGSSNYIYRGGCTDETWHSNSCAQECAFSPVSNTPDDWYTDILDCGNGTGTYNTNGQEWCCLGLTPSGQNCCDYPVHVAFGKPYMPGVKDEASTNSTSTSNSSATSSSSSFESSAAATGATSAGQENKNDSDSSSVKIGVGVGVGVGVLLLAVMVWFLFTERRKRVAAEKKMEAALAHRRNVSEQMPMISAHDNSSGAGYYSPQPDATKGRPELEARALGRPGVYEVQGS